MCRHAGEVKHAGHNGDCAADRKAQVRGDKQSGNCDRDADDARPDKQRLWAGYPRAQARGRCHEQGDGQNGADGGDDGGHRQADKAERQGIVKPTMRGRGGVEICLEEAAPTG